MNRMKLAENLYRLRRERGLSREELADRIGVTRQSVSKWETGQSLPDVDKLVELAALYGVTLDALAGGDPSEPSATGAARTNAGQAAEIGADGAAGGAAQTTAGQSPDTGAEGEGIVAIGDQGHGAEIFLHAGEATGRQIAEAIRLYLPRVPEWLIRIFSRFGV